MTSNNNVLYIVLSYTYLYFSEYLHTKTWEETTFYTVNEGCQTCLFNILTPHTTILAKKAFVDV